MGGDSERGRAGRVPDAVPLHGVWAHGAGGKDGLSSARTVHGSGQRGRLGVERAPEQASQKNQVEVAVSGDLASSVTLSCLCRLL